VTPGTSGENPLSWTGLDAVSESEPIDRPWNAPTKASILGRPEQYRASLKAASTLSVPEFVKRTLVGPWMGTRPFSSSASWISKA